MYFYFFIYFFFYLFIFLHRCDNLQVEFFFSNPLVSSLEKNCQESDMEILLAQRDNLFMASTFIVFRSTGRTARMSRI